MRLKNLLLISLFFSLYTIAQDPPDLGSTESHAYYVSELNALKDRNFQDILGRFNAYILAHPGHITAQIERCKFIGNSYWDEYEDYNLKWEETEECIADLYGKYPGNPELLLYRVETLYGEEKLQVLEDAERSIKNQPEDWTNIQIAAINEMLGDYYSENSILALEYYKKAQRLNEKLDLSYELANALNDQGKTELAREILLASADKDTTLWVMNQKANLLLQLREPEKALYLYDMIGSRDSTFINNNEMALAMAELGNFETSRELLVRDTLTEWNRVEGLQALLVHDLEHSDARTALATYRSLQKLDSYDDFLGVKRFQILIKNPLLGLNVSEVFHMALFGLSIVLLFLVPYLWVLPVYHLGNQISKKNSTLHQKLNFNWNLKHFWVISFLYLLVQYLGIIFFYYQDHINYYFNVVSTYIEETEDPVALARSSLFFMIGMVLSTLLVLNRRVLKPIYYSNISLLKNFALSIGFVIFNVILLKFLGNFIDLTETELSGVLLNAKEEIRALLQTYGFGFSVLFIAVIGPIYEEIIFRGVILGAVEKKVGFMVANVLQAALFALIHFDFKLFVFFFFFGLVLGHFANKTRGLLTGIIFHGVHNFFVLIAMYYITRAVV